MAGCAKQLLRLQPQRQRRRRLSGQAALWQRACRAGPSYPFGTNVIEGQNFFGQPLGPGDSSYDATQFSTTIASVGVWFDGYDTTRLAQTPRVYLLPAGSDVLRPRNTDKPPSLLERRRAAAPAALRAGRGGDVRSELDRDQRWVGRPDL